MSIIGKYVSAKLKNQVGCRQGWVFSENPLVLIGQNGDKYECVWLPTPVIVVNPPERLIKPEIVILTQDHPEANGRKPQAGEAQYILRFPTDDGKELVLKMGQGCMSTLQDLFFDMLTDKPSYNDGSTNA